MDDDYRNVTFYLCDMTSDNFSCPKKDTCKRYQLIKDVSYNDYKECAARLYNICKMNNYSMYLKCDSTTTNQQPISSNENSN